MHRQICFSLAQLEGAALGYSIEIIHLRSIHSRLEQEKEEEEEQLKGEKKSNGLNEKYEIRRNGHRSVEDKQWAPGRAAAGGREPGTRGYLSLARGGKDGGQTSLTF